MVAASQRRSQVFVIGADGCNSDGEIYGQGLGVEHHRRLFDLHTDPFRDGICPLLVRIRQHDHEFIPSKAGDQIKGTDLRAQYLRKGHKNRIPRFMTVIIVDRFEKVRIYQ